MAAFAIAGRDDLLETVQDRVRQLGAAGGRGPALIQPLCFLRRAVTVQRREQSDAKNSPRAEDRRRCAGVVSALLLIVEDDPDILDVLESTFEGRGFAVIAARNGAEAIDRTAAVGLRPSLILLDLHMPVMDGEAFLTIQPTQPLLADVPVVIMTAQLRQPEMLPATVRALLRKPIGLSVLFESVRRSLDRDTDPIVPPKQHEEARLQELLAVSGEDGEHVVADDADDLAVAPGGVMD